MTIEQAIKLALPRGYFSWTQMSTFLRSPKEWKRIYIDGEKQFVSQEMQAGKEAEETFVQSQTELLAMYKGIHLKGYADFYDDETGFLREDKTGKEPWTQQRVDDHGQLLFYALILREAGMPLTKIQLSWYKTKNEIDENGNKSIKMSNESVIFNREVPTDEEIDDFGSKLVKTVMDMAKFLTEFTLGSKSERIFDKYRELLEKKKALEWDILLLANKLKDEVEKNESKKKVFEWGSFSINTRKKWAYPQQVQDAEKVYKAARKASEADGSATFTEGDPFIVFRPTK